MRDTLQRCARRALNKHMETNSVMHLLEAPRDDICQTATERSEKNERHPERIQERFCCTSSQVNSPAVFTEEMGDRNPSLQKLNLLKVHRALLLISKKKKKKIPQINMLQLYK